MQRFSNTSFGRTLLRSDIGSLLLEQMFGLALCGLLILKTSISYSGLAGVLGCCWWLLLLFGCVFVQFDLCSYCC